MCSTLETSICIPLYCIVGKSKFVHGLLNGCGFNNNKPDGATIVQSNIIETATVPAGFYDGYDMVIFGGAAFNTIHANHWAALQTAIQNEMNSIQLPKNLRNLKVTCHF